MKLRLECYNSVDGSCRVVVLLGWLRLVCTNGLVIRETKIELSEIHDERLNLQRIPEIICAGMQEVRKDEARMRQWTQTAVTPTDIVPWANKDLSVAWGKKAACRVFHICNSGHDVEIDDPFASGEACDKPVHRLRRVPGSPEVATNLFDVAQAMSWIATQRNNPHERLEWQSQVPRLMSKIAAIAGREQGTAAQCSVKNHAGPHNHLELTLDRIKYLHNLRSERPTAQASPRSARFGFQLRCVQCKPHLLERRRLHCDGEQMPSSHAWAHP